MEFGVKLFMTIVLRMKISQEISQEITKKIFQEISKTFFSKNFFNFQTMIGDFFELCNNGCMRLLFGLKLKNIDNQCTLVDL